MAGVFIAAALALGGCSVFPEPLSDSEIKAFVTEDEKQILGEQESITAPVTLEEAIARAIKYNLDRRVVAMEDALANEDLDAAKWGLMPSLAASAGYAWRNQPDASNSQTEGGSESTSFTYSEDQHLWSGDLTMSWNILDFGVSYFRARQQANRIFIARERKRRAVHNLIMETRSAYWRAAAASIMEARVDQAMKDAQDALARLQKMLTEHLDEPVTIYRAQKSLVETIARLDSIRVDLAKAKPRLASLMNLKPGTDFRMAATPKDTFKAPAMPLTIDRMEEVVLAFRPELREAEYETRISLDETKKAFACMFPGIELSAGRNYTTDHFKAHPAWYNAGIQVTWNLLDILSAPNNIERADVQEEIARTQRMALNLAVLTQIHVSYRDFYSFVRQYEYAKRLWVLDQLVNRNSKQTYANEMESLLERLRAKVNVVQTELQFFGAYAAAQNGLGRLYASLGLDPLPDEMEDISVRGLTEAVRTTFTAWKAGRFPWNELAEEKTEGISGETAPVAEDVSVSSKGGAENGVEPAERDGSDEDKGVFATLWQWFSELL